MSRICCFPSASFERTFLPFKMRQKTHRHLFACAEALPPQCPAHCRLCTAKIRIEAFVYLFVNFLPRVANVDIIAIPSDFIGEIPSCHIIFNRQTIVPFYPAGPPGANQICVGGKISVGKRRVVFCEGAPEFIRNPAALHQSPADGFGVGAVHLPYVPGVEAGRGRPDSAAAEMGIVQQRNFCVCRISSSRRPPAKTSAQPSPPQAQRSVFP